VQQYSFWTYFQRLYLLFLKHVLCTKVDAHLMHRVHHYCSTSFESQSFSYLVWKTVHTLWIQRVWKYNRIRCTLTYVYFQFIPIIIVLLTTYIQRTQAHIEQRGKLDVSILLRERTKSMSHIHSCTYMLYSNYVSVQVGYVPNLFLVEISWTTRKDIYETW
jgi:hypothetical protein